MTAKFSFVIALLFCLTSPAKKHPDSPVEWGLRAVKEAMIAVPKDKEVCFSPDERCDVKLWKFIQTAQKTLDVAVYDITHPKIVHEILVASKKIKVRVVVDRKQSKGEHSLVDLLIKGGAAVKFGKQRGIMHNKFTVVDGARLETGSFNYSNNATNNNQENQLYLEDPAAVRRYADRFEKMWSEGKAADLSIAKY